MPDPHVERSKSARFQRLGRVVRLYLGSYWYLGGLGNVAKRLRAMLLYLLVGEGSSPEQEGEQ